MSPRGEAHEGRWSGPDGEGADQAEASDGEPATVHHANLGLIAEFLAFEGVYLLPSGDVAAVYGAEAVPVGC